MTKESVLESTNMLNIKGMNESKEIDGFLYYKQTHGDFSPNAREIGECLIPAQGNPSSIKT